MTHLRSFKNIHQSLSKEFQIMGLQRRCLRDSVTGQDHYLRMRTVMFSYQFLTKNYFREPLYRSDALI